MFLYALVLRLVWPVFVLVSELSASVSCLESIQRDLYQLPSRPGPRSSLEPATDGGTSVNALGGVEMDSYQGLVGRPGIDFPVLTHIPRTVFDCDDDSTNANEESRKALLEALINIGGVPGSQGGNELLSVSDGPQRDTAHRRGKEIGYNSGANALYDDLASTATVLNMTATTENYANVRGGSNDDSNSDEGGNQDEGLNSEEWLKGNDFQTTAATTKMYYLSAEAHTSYLPKAVNTQARWGYGYDEAQSTQYTTTPLPTTLSQTTVDSSSTIYTTTEPSVTTLSPAIAASDTSEYTSSTAITTTTTTGTMDTEYRSVESLESDSSSELKPPFVVSQRLPKDLTSSLGYPAGTSNKHHSPHNSDTRALELLKSLYSLAARWG